MRYQALYSVTFEALSDTQAWTIASKHHEQLRDELRIDGVDHPLDITLDGLQTAGRDVLPRPESKSI